MIALTVSECHFGSLAQSLRPQALTAARAPGGRRGGGGETRWCAPSLARGARAGGQMAVAREPVVEPLLLEDGERLAQAVEERQGRRIGEVAGRVRPHMVGKMEKEQP